MKTDSAIKPTTGLLLKPFLTIFLPTCVLFFLTSLYLFHSKKLAEIDRIQLIRSYEIDLLSQKLSSMLDVLPKDLRSISTSLERHVSLADDRSSDIPHTYDEHLTAVLMDTYEAREYYDQIRYIDRDGMEQIRIQRVNGQPFLVDNENRQNKSNRPYFTESIELSASSIYISPINLNQEFGRIELPPRFMLRIACPIGGHSGELNKGVLVFNYRVSELTKSLSQPSDLPGTECLSMLINADGLLMGTSKAPDGRGLSAQTAVAESLADTNPAVSGSVATRNRGAIHRRNGYVMDLQTGSTMAGKGLLLLT